MSPAASPAATATAGVLLQSLSVQLYPLHWKHVITARRCPGSLQGEFIMAFQYFQEMYRKDGDRYFSRAWGQGVMVLSWKRVGWSRYTEEYFYIEGDA